jgi:hypothetical protein
MRKLLYLVRELVYLVRKDRLYLLSAVFLFLVLLTVIVYQLAPAAVVTFIYAGV